MFTDLPEDYLFDLESEQRVLSAIIHSEDACIEAYNLLSVDEFYSPRNALIFELCHGLYLREVRPTLVEVLKEGHVRFIH